MKVMELLQREGANLSYADPFTPSVSLDGRSYRAVDLTEGALSKSHCALILTAHSAFDYDLVVRHAPLVFDTRNGTRDVKSPKEHVVLL